METITTAYEALGVYGALIMLTLLGAVTALGVWVYNLLAERDRLIQQLKAERAENAELRKQVNQHVLTIGQQKTQITGLYQVVNEQGSKLKQYETFIESLKKAQEKVRTERAGKPTDDVHVGGKPGAGPPPGATSNKKSNSNSLWLTGGLMLARVVLMTVGVPPIF